MGNFSLANELPLCSMDMNLFYFDLKINFNSNLAVHANTKINI